MSGHKESGSAEEKKSKQKSSVWSWVKTILIAVLIAVGIRSFVVEPFSIPSGSMIPTLLVGDYVLVTKYSFGYSKYSLPFDAFNLFNGRIFGKLPQIGDVVVFRLPRDPAINYIKRVIGLPGDTVQVIHSRLYINGQEVERVPDGKFFAHPGEGQQPFWAHQYIEKLPDGIKHKILQIGPNGPLDNTGVYHVPQGYIFVMGDDRDDSDDSRVMTGPYRVGYIPIQNLVGQAQYVFFSVNGHYPWYEFWKDVRWDRLFTKIQ